MVEKLLTAIQTGENYYIEFKKSMISNNEFLKEAIAFANAEGGTVFFGVDDDGSIKGLAQDDNLEERLMNIVRNNCYPSLHAEARA